MAERNEKMEKVVALNVKLTPVNQADQPVSANFSTVGVAQGIAYLDFGFIEPSELAKVVRRLQGQLGQVLAGLRRAGPRKPTSSG